MPNLFWWVVAIGCTAALWRSVGIQSPIVWAMLGADAATLILLVFFVFVEVSDA